MSYFTLFLEGGFFLQAFLLHRLDSKWICCPDPRREKSLSLHYLFRIQNNTWSEWLHCSPPPPQMVRRRPQVHQPQTAVCAVQVPLSNPGVQTHSPRTDFTLKNTGPYPNHNFFIWFEDARSLWFTRKSCHLCKPCFNSLQINTTALEYFCLWKQKTPESESNMKLLIHGGKSHLYF